jgi:hypothetical protein
MQVGLAERSGKRSLFLQSNPKFVSGSITSDLHGGSVECDFMTLEDLLQKVELSRVGLIKMDIEGAEYLVLRDWLKRGYRPPVDQIWVEFHPALAGSTPADTATLARDLEKIGFRVAKRAYFQDPNHYLFVDREKAGI